MDEPQVMEPEPPQETVDVEDIQRAHELLDSANVPRRRRGKVVLTLSQRLTILLERESPNDERTS